jgi:hypothetical protein
MIDFDPHFLFLALFFLLLEGLQALGEFGQSETLERLDTGLAVESGEQAGIGSLEDFDLAFDPLGAVFPVFFSVTVSRAWADPCAGSSVIATTRWP